MQDFEDTKLVNLGLNKNSMSFTAHYDISADIDIRSIQRLFRKTRIELSDNASDAFIETFCKMHESFSRQVKSLDNNSDSNSDDNQVIYSRLYDFDAHACETVSSFIPNSEITVVIGQLSKECYSPNDKSKPNYYNYFKLVFINGRVKNQQTGHYDIDADYLDEESLIMIPDSMMFADRKHIKDIVIALAEEAKLSAPSISDIRSKEAESIIDYGDYDPGMGVNLDRSL